MHDYYMKYIYIEKIYTRALRCTNVFLQGGPQEPSPQGPKEAHKGCRVVHKGSAHRPKGALKGPVGFMRAQGGPQEPQGSHKSPGELTRAQPTRAQGRSVFNPDLIMIFAMDSFWRLAGVETQLLGPETSIVVSRALYLG